MECAAWVRVVLHYLAVPQPLFPVSGEAFPCVLEQRELGVLADPNANESKMKTKAGRDSSRLQTRESPLQNPYHWGVSVF
jgi:hypothetical protein